MTTQVVSESSAVASRPRSDRDQPSTIIIRPSTGWAALNLPELWQYRDLLLILAARDVRLRYKQTALGVLWVILQPLLAALLFAVIFGRLARLPSDGTPYLLFAFCGLLPWNLFAGVLQRGGGSIVTDTKLIAKVYFPRLLVPLASTGAVLVDFLVALTVLSVLLPSYHVGVSWRIIALPFFLLLTVIGSTGIAFWIAALNVRYRDFAYTLPFVIQIWLFATPVTYAGTLIPRSWLWVYSLNPAAGYVEGFRWAILSRGAITPQSVGVTTLMSGGAFLAGAFFFRRVERGFADVI